MHSRDCNSLLVLVNYRVKMKAALKEVHYCFHSLERIANHVVQLALVAPASTTLAGLDAQRLGDTSVLDHFDIDVSVANCAFSVSSKVIDL